MINLKPSENSRGARKLLIISFITLLLMAVFHYFAIKYSWYWTYRWIDIPAHIVGGFGVALMSLWVCLKNKHIDHINGYKKKSLIVIIISVLIVVILWKIYELIFHITSMHNVGYWWETLKDILTSVVGGLIAYIYFIREKKSTKLSVSKVDSSLSMIIKH